MIKEILKDADAEDYMAIFVFLPLVIVFLIVIVSLFQ